MRRLWSLVQHDLKRWSRMPWAIALSLLPPALLALLVAALACNANCEPVALVVEGDGANTRRLCEIVAADTDAYQLTIASMEQAMAELAHQQIAAIIVIPSDFDAQAARHAARVRLLLDNIDSDVADDLRRSLDRSAGAFDGMACELDNDDEPTAALTTSAPAQPAPAASNAYRLSIDEHDVRQTSIGLLPYQLAPILVLLVLQVGMLGTALLGSSEAEGGIAPLLRMCPLPAWHLLLGRIIAGSLTSLGALLPATALALHYGVVAVPPGHGPMLVALAIATACAAAGAGALLGTLVPGARLAALSASVVAMLAFLLGGGFTTMVFLPSWVRVIAACDPIRYAIDGAREAMFYPSLQGCGLDLLVLSAAAAAAIAASAAMAKWR